nr:pitrilysin family protein [Kofleriaceae bacterium]
MPAVDTATLGNGLQIAVVSVDGPPVVAVQVWYHVGSKDDPRDRRGLARLFEYLMFQGSEHVRPGGHGDLIGALGGFVNGHVDEDASHFGETLPVSDLDTALKLEADRMRGLVLRDVNVQATRQLAAEQAKNESATPVAAGMAHLLSIAFPTAGYAWNPSGVASDIDSITLDDVKKLYDAYYQPNNALLVVVGKTTLADVKAAADRAFGQLPRAETPKRAEAEHDQSGSRREVLEAGPVGLALFGFHIPPARDPDFYPVQLAAMMLGVGDDARLKKRLHTKDAKTGELLAVDGGIDLHVHENPGLLVLVGAYREPSHGQAVEDAMTDEIKRLGTSGPDEAELHRVKRQVESGFVFSLEHTDGFAETVGRAWITTGDATSWQHDADKFEKVTAGDVERVVKQYMNADRATLVVVPPKGP